MSYLAVNTYEAVIVPILADFTPESVESLVNHSDSMALLTNADKWAKLDIAKMPEVKVVMDVDNLKILTAASLRSRPSGTTSTTFSPRNILTDSARRT